MDDPGNVTRLTNEELEFLLDFTSLDSPCPSPCTVAGSAGSPPGPLPLLPKFTRQGRQGIGLSIAEASSLWHAALNRAMAAGLGLEAPHWSILWLLAVQGGELPKRAICQTLGVCSSEMEAVIASLRSGGYVRLLDAAEAGEPEIALADLATVQRIFSIAASFRDKALRGIGDEEIAPMHATLLKVIANLREDEAGTQPEG